MDNFIKEQIVHLVNIILNYIRDDEKKDFESTFGVDPIDIDRIEYERILNESEHIYKYIYALERIIQTISDEKI
tara:strand:+ start:1114 stop:1335 length:222 start_codon:yes stop_codon:yes gene_type:complete